jgi:hypothetical protein
LKKLRSYLILLSLLLISCLKSNGQTLTYQFIDPCTKVITYFSVPATGTTVFFLGKSAQFTSADVTSGAFGAWVNQAYADYRKISPCGQQQGQVIQNQITSQIISNTVQSVVSSIMSQAQSAASGTIDNTPLAGGTDAAGKNNKESSNKKSKSKNGNNSNNNIPATTSSNSGNGSGTNVSGTGQSGNNTPKNNNESGTGAGNNTSTGGSSNGSSNQSGSSQTSSSSSTTSSQSSQNNKAGEKGEEVAATTTMNIDQQNQNSSKDNNGSSKGKNGKNGTNNPIIVSSDFTTAQNLDKTFTPILNLSMSQSSMTGMSSWGLTSMIWFNLKQFAISGKYTKINFSKNGKLKWVHNINLTSVYSYGNIIGFVGYSGILNAGKWGVTGFNASAAMTLVTGDQKNTFVSPSFTAFYTKPFKGGKRLTVSPELYVISTPLLYSTKDKVTTTDRTFSAFIGSGFDYQITRRFKLNMNYKANMSTNPDFPVLSFFLIGSKVNL